MCIYTPARGQGNTHTHTHTHTEAEHLEHKIRKLEHETKEKGQHATVMVDTAKRLLQSARAMSQVIFFFLIFFFFVFFERVLEG